MLNSIILLTIIIYFQCYVSVVGAVGFIPRIVNGKRVDIHEIPYQIQIEYKNQLNCGGSIVSEKHVVTAAHCFTMTRNPKRYRIRAGTNYRSEDGIVYKIDTIVIHPSFIQRTLDCDAAVVTIKNRFEFCDTIQSIKMAISSETLPVNREGRVSGWGRTAFNGRPSYVLLNTYVPVMSHEVCKNYYKSIHIITEQMFCAGYPNGGYDACTGDSGGPFVINRELLGIVSWGIDCGKSKYPGVYTSVPSVYDWLQQQISVI